MTFLVSKENRQDFIHAQTAVAQLHQAGVPILAGTDASNPGTAHGASLHRELELLVQAGLSPSDALAAATSVPARAFGLLDRGTIHPGKRADLVMVRGNPLLDITKTRDISRVWKAGVEVDRPEIVRQSQHVEDSGPARAGDGLMSHFDDGTLQTSFGLGWSAVSDKAVGGDSYADVALVSGGCDNQGNSLLVSGEIAAEQTQFSWAGTAFYPGRGPFSPVNLSSKKTISFWTTGDGGDYSLMINSWNNGIHRSSQPFRAGSEWQQYRFLISEFQTDGKGILAIFFLAGPRSGQFKFRLDDVCLE